MFKDRRDAGLQLSRKLKHYKDGSKILVLALPRGGIVPALEVALALSAPLDVLIVRKIGFPRQRELAIGAVSETGTVVLNQNIVSYGQVSKEYLDREIAVQKEEIERRVRLYRGGKRIERLEDRTIILVDDGVATGATMKAAIVTLKGEKIKRLVVAVPVAPFQTAEELRQMVDDFVCLHVTSDFFAVGQFYSDFEQVSDEEVTEILKNYATMMEA